MRDVEAIIIDSDEKRRRTLALLVKATTLLSVKGFPVLSAAFPGFCDPTKPVLSEATKLFLCPWDEGGEAMLLERIALGVPGPVLLILSDEVTPSRIGLCHRAGNAHLIPSQQLNLNALRTRVLLSTEGPVTLAERVSRSGVAMRKKLSAFPGLKRRLALG